MWKEKDGKLVRAFKFHDFTEAWDFMNQVALLIEKVNHHPSWSNTYNKVQIELTTHDAGNTITQKDRDLADGIDKILLSK